LIDDFLWWLDGSIGLDRLTYIICALSIVLSIASLVVTFA